MRNKWLAVGMFVAVTIACLSLAHPAAKADEAKSAKDVAKKIEPWKPEDFIYTENAGYVRISRDAKWLAWVKSTTDKEKDGRVSGDRP